MELGLQIFFLSLSVPVQHVWYMEKPLSEIASKTHFCFVQHGSLFPIVQRADSLLYRPRAG